MQYEAIVLKTEPFRESDRIVTFFTQEEGLLRVIAKGSQKIVSKNASHLEPGVHVSIGVAKGKEIDYLTTIQPIEFFSEIRNTLLKSVGVLYVLQLFSLILLEKEKQEALYKELLLWLILVNKIPLFQMRLIDVFLFRCMHLLGFAPQLQRETEEALVGFSPFAGGMITTSESRIHIQEKRKVFACSALLQHILLSWGNDSWEIVLALEISYTDAIQLHNIVYAYVQFHLERSFADWEKVLYAYEGT